MSESTEKKAGLNSLRFTQAFKAANFELFTKPNKVIMALGLTCLGLSVLYITKMGTPVENFEDYEEAYGNDEMIGKLLKERKPKGEF